MTQINPFAGAIAQTPQAAKLAAIDRDAQVRKTAGKSRTGGYDAHNVDEFVESADTIVGVGDDDAHEDPRQRKRRKSNETPDPNTPDDAPHIDVRA